MYAPGEKQKQSRQNKTKQNERQRQRDKSVFYEMCMNRNNLFINLRRTILTFRPARFWYIKLEKKSFPP